MNSFLGGNRNRTCQKYPPYFTFLFIYFFSSNRRGWGPGYKRSWYLQFVFQYGDQDHLYPVLIFFFSNRRFEYKPFFLINIEVIATGIEPVHEFAITVYYMLVVVFKCFGLIFGNTFYYFFINEYKHLNTIKNNIKNVV